MIERDKFEPRMIRIVVCGKAAGVRDLEVRVEAPETVMDETIVDTLLDRPLGGRNKAQWSSCGCMSF